MNKIVPTFAEAVADIPDGATLMIDGFAGPGGTPQNLIRALRDHGARDLTIISNTAGLASVTGFGTVPGDRPTDIGVLVENEQVKKVIASFPVSPSASRPTAFERAYREGNAELEVVPQGTLAERIRAGGAGIPAFYTPTGAGTLIAEGKEVRTFDGREHLLEIGAQGGLRPASRAQIGRAGQHAVPGHVEELQRGHGNGRRRGGHGGGRDSGAWGDRPGRGTHARYLREPYRQGELRTPT